MSRVIFKYEIKRALQTILTLPDGFVVRHFGIDNHGVTCIWVENPSELAPEVQVEFSLFGTGHSFEPPRDRALKYIGTTVDPHGITVHLYQHTNAPKAEIAAEPPRSLQHLYDLIYVQECQIIQLSKDKAHFERELAITQREHSEAHLKNVRLEAGIQALLGDDSIKHVEALHRTVDIVGLHRLLQGGWRCDHCKGTGAILEADGMGGALAYKECPVCGGYGIEAPEESDDQGS